MPNRVIRDSILDSERYWGCTIEARELFFHMMLLADDYGCISLAPLMLKRRCFENPPSNDKLASLLSQLCDADLIRRYESNGAYALIPRFRQRLQIMSPKHPKPPPELYKDDEWLAEQFNKINNKTKNPTVGQHREQQLPNAMSNTVAIDLNRSEEKRKEENRRESPNSVRSLMPDALRRIAGESPIEYQNRLVKFSKSLNDETNAKRIESESKPASQVIDKGSQTSESSDVENAAGGADG